MEYRFNKYHGTGNDFILIDDRDLQFPAGEKEVISKLCDRRFGIGADGLILLQNAHGYDFRMKYYNSDGLESTMCGNGGRCIVAFADFLSLFSGKCRFLAADGPHTGIVLSKQDNTTDVRLGMNDVSGISSQGNDFITDTGSPHYVKFVNDVDAVDVISEGRKIRYSEEYKDRGINVNFVEQRDGMIYVRSYERGVEDETLSCGTGVTASSLVFSNIHGLKEGKIGIITRGGPLSLYFRRNKETYTDIWLEGPAARVFTGFINV